ncbi:uncharacterized protein LOC122047711 isoform X1 [Zingiber officinale]|uniref:uncharacterized protein LOC122047711 isoform X1 n=1 Tax=Zingiber officinale TaxID=94328 RepID=UPI001C4C1786|nr:uncharacterized protein LOC122047711 isoform X1 [Zingiber officinale]
MANQNPKRFLQSFFDFTERESSPNSGSLKIKSLFKGCVFRYASHLIHALSKKKWRRQRKGQQFELLNLQLNWSPPHVISPIPELPVFEMSLAGHLEWVEDDLEALGEEDGENEIDQLAEKFIASCHEKFRLEKEESYRRYQEMLERST